MLKIFKKKEKVHIPTRKETFLANIGRSILLLETIKGETISRRYLDYCYSSFQPIECKKIEGKITDATNECIKVDNTWYIIGDGPGKIYEWFILK
jgi:hypothetical protein